MTRPLNSYRKHNLCGALIAGLTYRVYQALKGGEEGKVRIEGGGHDEEVASFKFNTSIQKWSAVDIYLESSRLGIYPLLFTSPSGDSSVYNRFLTFFVSSPSI